MLIGGGDISSDVITRGTFFSMLVYIRACLRFALIGGTLTAQPTGSNRGIGAAFSRPPPEHPGESPGELVHRLF